MKKLLTILLSIACSINLLAQEPYSFTGVDTILSEYAGYNVYPRTSSQAVDIRNSKFSKPILAGYILQAGDDSYNVTSAHNLDGAIIKGNYIEYTGTPNSVHAIMAGYNSNYDIAYNYIDNAGYSVVWELGYDDGTPMANTSGGIHSNIIRNCSYTYLWGSDSARFYNNTFYSSRIAAWPVRVGKSNGTTIDAYAKNAQIVNNIFYTIAQDEVLSIETDCDSGLVVDYNIYYCETGTNNEPKFELNGSTLTWTQWRAEGYDAHSVILDPQFVDTINFIPAANIAIGADLGSEYEYSLATTSDWIVGTTPDTVQQGDNWQVGAVIHSGVDLGGFYIAPWGSDDSAGTFTSPWLTWVHGFNQLSAGDTLYIRDGVYYQENSSSARIYIYQENGTAENPIVVMNYPDEVPILDGINFVTPMHTYGIYLHECAYWELIGLTIRNIDDQPSATDYDAHGIRIRACTNTTVKYCRVHDIGGRGIQIEGAGSDGNLIYNCDSYDNWDDEDDGESADGFGILSTSAGSTNTIKGCRAWNNSDDGYDFFASNGIVICDSCWSFSNGKYGDSGDGAGFKLGVQVYYESSLYLREVTNCLSAVNDGPSFTRNEHYGKMILYNNTSYAPGGGGFSMGLGGTYTRDTAVLKNNVSYLPGTGTHYSSNGQDTTEYNSWDAGTGVTVTAADFVSLDTLELYLPRVGADSTLPDISFMHLAQGSDLIDAGVDVGIAYLDAAPDLGAFEFVSPGSPPSTGYKLTGGDGKILTDGNGKIITGR